MDKFGGVIDRSLEASFAALWKSRGRSLNSSSVWFFVDGAIHSQKDGVKDP
jgi:hypothetical protein